MVAPRSRFASARSVPGWLTEALAVGLAFVAVAIAMTWPLVLHVGSRIPGGGAFYDPTGYYYDFWYFSTHGFKLVGSGTMALLDAPFGRPIVPASYLEQIVSYGPGVLISWVWNPAAGLSIVAIAALAGSGGAMYGLVRWLGAGWIAAGWAGLALMLSPYMTYRVGVHIPLANLACLPLVILAGLAWMERQSLARAVWVALSLVFAWLTNPYYGFMCTTMMAVIGLAGLVLAWRVRGARFAVRRLVMLTLCTVGLVVVPLVVLLKTSGPAVQDVFGRTVRELSLYGAQVTDYVWPSHASRLMQWVLGSRWGGSPGGEATVFLGWSTIVLAGAWAILARRRWAATAWRMRLMGAVAGPLVIVLGLVSLASPYRVAGLSVNAPSYYVFGVVPFIRAYARFGGAVMVVVVVIAALGVDWLVGRVRRPYGVLVGACLVAVSAIELPVAMPIASAPPLVAGAQYGAPASQFAVWRWLAGQRPDGALIELPASSIEPPPYRGYSDRIYMYGQTLNGWTLANGGLGEVSLGEDFGRLVGSPLYPDVAANLATAGVTRVVVNPWGFAQAHLDVPDTATPPPGFVVLRLYPDGTAIWQVTAPAKPGLAIFRAGFSRIGVSDTWVLSQRSGTVTLYTRAQGEYFVDVAFASVGTSGTVQVAIDGGPVLRLPIGPDPAQPVWIPVHLSAGQTDVRVGVQPAPEGRAPVILTQGWQVLSAAGPAGAAR